MSQIASADKATDRSVARRDFLPSRRATSYDFISPLSLNLHGSNILITGSALPDGVGFATARAFARAGASGIVLADLHDVPPELVAQLKAAAVDAKRSEPTVITRQVDISKLGKPFRTRFAARDPGLAPERTLD